MWGNIILSISNLYGLLGVYYFFEKGYVVPGLLHMFWVIFASVYHLTETGKHDMPGVFTPPTSPYVQGQLNFTTFVFAFASSITWFFLLIVKDLYIIKMLTLSAVCFAIPELVTHITGKPHKLVYVIFHSLSHMLTFCVPNTMGRDDPITYLLR